MRFLRPLFDNGDIEIRCDGMEVAIYASERGLHELANMCLRIAKDLKTKESAHIHIADYELLTEKSMRAVIVGLRADESGDKQG